MEEVEAALLVQILRVIYCRSISREFRQPVDVMYPNEELVKAYSSVIQYPMDLGTLLHGAMKRKLKVSNYRDGLKLVFRNAIQFNSDTFIVINVAKHLNTLSCGLYEEAFCQPYGHMSDLNIPPSTPLIAKDEFLFSRNCRRVHYFSMLRSQPLKYTEVENMLQLIQAAAATTNTQMNKSGYEFPKDLVIIMEACLKVGSSGLDTFNMTHTSPYLSISEILRPLLDFLNMLITSSSQALIQLNLQYDPTNVWTSENILKQQIPNLLILLNNNGNTSLDLTLKNISNPPTATSVMNIKTTEKIAIIMSLMSPYLPYLRILDENLGALLVCVYERITRGNVNSSIWAVPLSCGWVTTTNSTVSGRHTTKIDNINLQNNCVGGWPVMILISGYTYKDRVDGINSLLCEANIERIPKHIIDSLNESSSSSSSSSSLSSQSNPTEKKLIIREGYTLVEYISLNQYEWVPSQHVKRLNSVELKSHAQNHTSLMKKNSMTDKTLSGAFSDAFKTCLWLDLKTTEFIDNMVLTPNTSGMKKNGINPDDFYDIADPPLKVLEKSLQKPATTSTSSGAGAIGLKQSSTSSHNTSNNQSDDDEDDDGSEEQLQEQTGHTTNTNNSQSRLSKESKSSTTKTSNKKPRSGGSKVTVSSSHLTGSNNNDDDDDDDDEDEDDEDIEEEIHGLKTTTTATSSKNNNTISSQQVLNQIKLLFGRSNTDGSINSSLISSSGSGSTSHSNGDNFTTFKVSMLPPVSLAEGKSKKLKSINRTRFFGAWSSQFKFPPTPQVPSNYMTLSTSGSTTSLSAASATAVAVTSNITDEVTTTTATATNKGKKRKLSNDTNEITSGTTGAATGIKAPIKRRSKGGDSAVTTASGSKATGNKKVKLTIEAQGQDMQIYDKEGGNINTVDVIEQKEVIRSK